MNVQVLEWGAFVDAVWFAEAETDVAKAVLSADVLINVPYHPECGMWFDHHQHTATYQEPPQDFKGVYGLAPSAARLVPKTSLRAAKPRAGRPSSGSFSWGKMIIKGTTARSWTISMPIITLLDRVPIHP